MNQDQMTKINEGLPELFDDITKSMNHFRKKTYADTFEAYEKKYQPLLQAIPAAYHESEDPGEMLTAIAGILPNRVLALLEEIPQKRRREIRVLDYNLGMVSYLIPLLNNIRDECMKTVTSRIIEQWNQTFPTGKISSSTYEGIKGGFKSGLCYITTAVCESMGKPDDCYELTLLREYRDTYLMDHTMDGGALIKNYYDVAPTIVKHINRRENAAAIYQSVWTTYLSPCIDYIKSNQQEACRALYSKMVTELQETYFYTHGGKTDA